jgi:hydrogenase nickel incorporation protein HypA/HybF
MHELSIAQSIAEVVGARAAECDAARVKRVRLRVGEASGVVTDSLAFCFEMVASQMPVLEGAALSIDRVPHLARCRHCDTEFAVVNYVAQCPTCQEWSGEIVSGTELQIVEMEIERNDEDA